ncbi:MAG: hypothetical protein INQ03_04200 [Candidatus Heimdallarchaeota archaeon]|nr:hypothetical protein [Candidatus Heimdallarchaeota archaeon]
MSTGKRVVYLCNECNITQNIVFTPEMKEEYIPKDLNGLALYSHIHTCALGMLGVNNLYIDHNLDVRSYQYIKLPKYVPKKKVAIPMPGAPKVGGEAGLKELKITQVARKNDLNLVINFELIGTELTIGTFDRKNSPPVKKLSSDMEMVSLIYYRSNTGYTSQIEKWLIEFVNSIEMIPPSKLGIIVEVLRYILEEKDNEPGEFEKMILKTILASHEIYFQNNNTNLDVSFLKELYGENEGNAMASILDLIDQFPLMPLHNYALNLDEEIVFVIYCFLIMEKHGLITIHRPGIIMFN